jgi:biotin transport system substrate-specific component
MRSHVISGSLVDCATVASPFASALRFASVAFGMTLTAAAAQFTLPMPFTAVPFVLTPMAVLLAGAALGARRGAYAQIAYLAAGMVGLQVFAPSAILPPGAARLLGPTGGFLMAYPLAAFLTGRLAERGWDRRYITSAFAMVAGLAVIYFGGALWYTATVSHSLAITFNTSVAPFIGLDVAKILVASAVLPTAWKFLRQD